MHDLSAFDFLSWRLLQSRSLFLSNDVTIVHSDRMKTRLLNIEWNMFLYVAIQPLWCHSNFIMSFKLYGAIQTSWYHSNFLVPFKLYVAIQTGWCHSFIQIWCHIDFWCHSDFMVPFRLHGPSQTSWCSTRLVLIPWRRISLLCFNKHYFLFCARFLYVIKF